MVTLATSQRNRRSNQKREDQAPGVTLATSQRDRRSNRKWEDQAPGVTLAPSQRDRRSSRKREDRAPGKPASATDQGDRRVWPVSGGRALRSVLSGWRSVLPQER
ncbi:hypothetical protein GCM10010112_39530 [Actinoplanes lobatus]|uniref:Uncharacterized protein n=1 Tax=Actinoplanes lobatus TaxID=113568 RepID=A0ABQ4AXH5_9ACTN|nr:hypothetical protein GCM10010112_39530 [Actinoplanes lobatus]GIE45269.1 hypothetical protein Alo02nite_81670 [Actinoplanes lobatus]